MFDNEFAGLFSVDVSFDYPEKERYFDGNRDKIKTPTITWREEFINNLWREMTDNRKFYCRAYEHGVQELVRNAECRRAETGVTHLAGVNVVGLRYSISDDPEFTPTERYAGLLIGRIHFTIEAVGYKPRETPLKIQELENKI